MKTKIVFISSAILLSGALFSIAGAQGLGVNVDANVEVETHASASSSSTEAKSDVHGNATGTAANTSDHGNISASSSTQGEVTSSEHRSAVATFVDTLLDVANKEGGIGAEVRAIAKAQNDSASTTANAMAKVDEKGAVATFLFGSDYKNLGVIRSELATTSNGIARLKAVLDKTVNAEDRAELSAQIQVLEAEHAKVDAYVTAHEDSFSVFGWFVKLFQ